MINARDGLIGNEDCGQMSAWYVMSSMGFYEVTPGYPYYAIGSPSFDTVKIHLENRNTFSVIANNNSQANFYINNISLPEKPEEEIASHGGYISSIHGSDFSYESIMKGQKIEMGMTMYQPTRAILYVDGIKIGKNAFIPNPVIESASNSFSNELLISISTADFPTKQKIYFTQDGTEPTIHSKKYSIPFTITSTQTIKAIAIDEYGNKSKVVTASFHKIDHNWKVAYLTNYNSQYAGIGNMTLIDGESGTTDFRNGQWQGWWSDDMQVIVDLGKETSISKVAAEFLQDQRPWILMPRNIEVGISSDGKNFIPVGTIECTTSDRDETPQTTQLILAIRKQTARYVKITAKNYGTLPSWHAGAGGKAWIFCDEIFVE